MKSIYCFLFVASLVFLVTGCGTPIGKQRFPQPSAGFTPKRIYEADFENVWKAANDALDENHIGVVSSDVASGRIQTDTVQGATTLYAGGLGGYGESRYSFNVRVTVQEGGKTKLLIIAKIEQTSNGFAEGDSATPYRDLSGQNQPLVQSLENWLYEQIEKKL